MAGNLKSMRIRVATATLVVLLGTLLAIDAAAAPGPRTGPGELRYPSLLKAVPDADDDETRGRTRGSVRCPSSHSHPTGGGIEIGLPPTSVFDMEVSATTVTPGASGWEAQSNNNTGSSGQMTVTAICAKRGEYDYRSALRNIPVGTQVEKRAKCPNGTDVVGGGVETSSESFQIEAVSSEPFDDDDRNSKPDDGWLGAANNETDSVETMEVVAVCARNGDYKYVHSRRLNLPDNTQVTTKARCPRGRQVTGGGVDISGIEPDTAIVTTAPSDSGDNGTKPDDLWLGTANNDNSGQDERVRVFAICSK